MCVNVNMVLLPKCTTNCWNLYLLSIAGTGKPRVTLFLNENGPIRFSGDILQRCTGCGVIHTACLTNVGIIINHKRISTRKGMLCN